jgi:hypothetical protein
VWWKPVAIVIFAAAILLPLYFRGNLDFDRLNAALPAASKKASGGGGNGSGAALVSVSDGSGDGSTSRVDRDWSTSVPVDYSKTGVFFPLFTQPGRFWDQMLEYRMEHPSLPWISVINPDNGPGKRPNPLYVQHLQDLKEAKVLVLGYVSTYWAAVPIETAKEDIRKYKEFYNLDGIFIDEMSNLKEFVPYYRELVSYAKSLGLNYTIGNTGTDAAPEYVGVVDNIVISEGYGVPTLSRLAGWHADHDKSNFSYIAHSQTTVDKVFISTAKDFASFVYVTDDTMPNPYNKFPSYFDDLLQVLDPKAKNNLHNLAIKSVDLAGAPVNGTLQISSAATTVAAADGGNDGNNSNGDDLSKPLNGREWVTYVGEGGKTYTVRALDNRDYVFEHWEDGSRDRTRTVSLDNGTSAVLTAYYNSKDAADRPKPGLTISALTDRGAELSMWTIIQSANGTTVKTGFTPLRFTEGVPGQTYKVFVADWEYFKFNHWVAGGSNNNSNSAWQSVRYTGDEQYVAAYFSYNPPDRPLNTLTINTYDSSGQIVSMYATVNVVGGNSTTLQSGYTPWTLPVKAGQQYSVTAYDYKEHVFDQWENGSKNRTATVTVDSLHEKLVGYYRVVNSSNSARPAAAAASVK